MKNSLLLTGLAQRLLLATIALCLLWGVYFWAVSGEAANMDMDEPPVAEHIE
ncbi:hypothetical protein [Wielerella bovis]|uniref:hypothetical protein n=1 Tax=Wielerella bovis TaxID=2917790 RepID=UPI002019F931|nr:hypothetical protein [Wielerella bovis]ULJ61138.1 hypothetical protein MIS44_04610 [Wielerella bovis]